MTTHSKPDTELAPCPFCGGEARLMIGEHNVVDASIHCESCGIQGPCFDDDEFLPGADCADPKGTAIEHWNARIPAQQQSEETDGNPDPYHPFLHRGTGAFPVTEIQDVRWAVNVLLEKIAVKFEAWDTMDLWRSDAAQTVRGFKHDLAAPLSPQERRTCTCHPDDNPPRPCPQKFAYSDCVAAAQEAAAPHDSGLYTCIDAAIASPDRIFNETCPRCGGSGDHPGGPPGNQMCSDCKGRGFIPSKRSQEVKAEDIATTIARAFGSYCDLDKPDGKQYWLNNKDRHIKEARAILAKYAVRAKR